jgi:rhomboid family GlyGly-CTERM serine protease
MAGQGRRLAIAGLAITALAALLLAAAHPFPPAADALHLLLCYERSAILNGEWWRLVTAHGVHLGPLHLGMNMLALCVILLLCRPVLTLAQAFTCLLLYAPVVSLALLMFTPDIAWYAGLSGVLHGLLVTGAVRLLRGRPEAALLLAVVLVKLVAEQSGFWLSGAGRWLDVPVIVDAHLYGALAGLCGVLFLEVSRVLRGACTRCCVPDGMQRP